MFPPIINATSIEDMSLEEEEVYLQELDEIAKDEAEIFDFDEFYNQQNTYSTYSLGTSVLGNVNDGSLSRIAGSNRMETAIKLSNAVYSKGSTDTVILAGYNGSADALTGTNFSKSLNAPILLIGNSVTSELKREFDRLGTKIVWLLGGNSAISKDVENELESMGYDVNRISGRNRFETSSKIANTSIQKKKVFLTLGVNKRFDGTDDVLADALSVGPVSAKLNMPILLTETSKLPKETRMYLKNMSVTNVTIVGGNNAISANVEKEIKDMNIKVDRISGDNRYITAVNVAKKYIPNPSKVVIASGTSDVDALVGGYYAYNKNATIVLTPKSTLDPTTRDYLKDTFVASTMIGGTSVIDNNVFAMIRDIITPSQHPIGPSTPPVSPTGKASVCIDYGHGGSDPGAGYNGRWEKNDTYTLGKLVTQKLRSRGVIVDETRKGDEYVTLRNRSDFSKKKNYNYVVSIHRNAFQPEKAQGVETFVYPKPLTKSVSLAKEVQKNLVDVGFTDRKVKSANFHMVREPNAPSILIEVGFIDHTKDNSIFDRKLNTIAEAISSGILKELGM